MFSHTRDVVGIWRKHGSSATVALAGRDLGGANLAMTLALQTRQQLVGQRRLPAVGMVRRSWTEASARNIVQVGRILLRERRYAEARRLAWGAMRLKVGAAQRLKMLAIAVAAIGRIDLERISRWRGRRSTIEELV
ncbi:MAG: hypothetical protein E6I18_17000 [Chloroflexi bacterium]|nr:MAG: hypothetical protein E6I18_17000 [Chloroflexota bacterium]